MQNNDDRPSLPLNVAFFAGTFIISLCLGFAMLLFWLVVIVAAFGVSLSPATSPRTKSAYRSAAWCVLFFLLAFLLWPLFRIISPQYFDER